MKLEVRKMVFENVWESWDRLCRCGPVLKQDVLALACQSVFLIAGNVYYIQYV